MIASAHAVRRRMSTFALAVIGALVAASGMAAETGEPVQLRAAVHPDFGRLVLEWPAAVSVERRWDGGELELRFDRPFAADITGASGGLDQFLSSLRREDSGRALRIGLRPGIALGRFRQFEPELVVLDFMPEDSAPKASAGEVSARTGEHKNYLRLVLDFASPVVHRLERVGDRHVLTFDRLASFDTANLGRELRSVLEEFAPSPGERAGLIFRVKPEVEAEVFALDEDKIVIDFRITEPSRSGSTGGAATPSAASERPSPPENDEVRAAAAPRSPTLPRSRVLMPPPSADTTLVPALQRNERGTATPVHEAPNATRQNVETPRLAIDRTPRGIELSAVWPEPVPAAVFSRAGILWMVFDAGAASKSAIDVPDLEPGLQAVIGEPELVWPVDGVSVLRLPLRRDLSAWVEAEGATWRLLLRPDSKPPAPVDIVRLREPKRLRIEGAGGRFITMTDPVVGDRLVIWPLLGPVRGVEQPLTLVQLELLPTAQGVVVREIADGLEVGARADGLEIAAAGGLHLSLPAAREVQDRAAPEPGGGHRRTNRARGPAEGPLDHPGAESRSEDEPAVFQGQPQPGSERDDEPGSATASGGGRQEKPAIDPAGPARPPAGEPLQPREHGAPPEAVRDAVPAAAEHEEHPAGPAQLKSPRLRAGQPALGLAAFILAENDSSDQRRARLLRALEDADESAKAQARLDLARFFLAQAMAAETLAVLDDITPGGRQGEPLELARRALAGAAELLMGRLPAAERALQAPGLDGDPEVSLWRAALAAAKTDWAAAARELERSADTLVGYPPLLQLRLGMPAAMIALEADDLDRVFEILDQVGGHDLHPRDRTQLDFIRGLAHARTGAAEEALRIWGEVAAGPDEETRINAQYALADLLFQEGKISAEEALARLLAARPLWRGRAWEASMLDGLAEIQQAGDDPASAVRTWYELRRLHPTAAEQLAVGPKIDRAFVKALAGPDDDPLAPVRALALYRDYPDRLPAGDAGRELRRALAERLADLDLIDSARALLREVLVELPAGPEAAREGAMLASLELRGPDAEAALEVLDATAAPELPVKLAAERRILRARGLAAAGRPSDALELLSGRGDPVSQAVRNDVHWQQRDWRRLAVSLEAGLAGIDAASGGLSPEEQTSVVKLAIAYGQFDGDALRRLEQRFGLAMRGSPAAAAFLMATRPKRQGSDPDAILALVEREVKDVQAYLEETGTR